MHPNRVFVPRILALDDVAKIPGEGEATPVPQRRTSQVPHAKAWGMDLVHAGQVMLLEVVFTQTRLWEQWQREGLYGDTWTILPLGRFVIALNISNKPAANNDRARKAVG